MFGVITNVIWIAVASIACSRLKIWPPKKPLTLMILYFDMLTSNESDTVGEERGQVSQRWWLRWKKKGRVWKQMEMCVRAGVVFEARRGRSKKLGWDGEPEKRQNVWMHLRVSRDKKGSSGVRGLLLGLPNPQAQPSLQGMPQIWLSGSPCKRPSLHQQI